jgi:opine dehydrogenase
MRYAVVGAGCGGQAVAAVLAYKGHDVALYDRSPSRIASFRNQRRIRLCGEIEGVGELSYVGTDLSMAVENRDIVVIVTTAIAHKPLALQLAPLLCDGQIVLVTPGRTFGALEVSLAIQASGCSADIVVGEANTLPYVSRSDGAGTILINAVKKKVLVSAIRACDTPYLVDCLDDALPQFIAADSFLETSFGNIGARLHPAILLGNKRKIRLGVPFDFYAEGVTPDIASVLSQVDSEIRAVSGELCIPFVSIEEWLCSRYDIEPADIGTMLGSNPGYQNIKAPTAFDHRYLWDDIPTGLVPIAQIAQALNVETPIINTLIDQGERILGRVFREEGRTMEKLGLTARHVREELTSIIGDTEDLTEDLMERVGV